MFDTPFISPPDPDPSADVPLITLGWHPANGTEIGRFGPEIDRIDAETGPDRRIPAASGLMGDPRSVADRPRPRNDRLAVRCSAEYHAWAAGLADFTGCSGLTHLVEIALRRLAECYQYPTLPPRRYRSSARPRPGRGRRGA